MLKYTKARLTNITVWIFGFGFIIMSGCSRKDSYQCAITQAKDGNFDKAINRLAKAEKANPSSAKVHYGLGAVYLEKGMLEEALAEFNKGVELDTDYKVEPDPHVLAMLSQVELHADWDIGKDLTLKSQKIFKPEEITKKEFSMPSIKYAWRRIIYKMISDNIIKGLASDEEKLFALLDWTYRNVSIVNPSGRSYFALPLDVMLRGYGLCDRSAWAFTTLASQAGYRANKFSLYDPAKDDYIHTVALVYLHDKWVVFDTYNGIVFRMSDGSLAGLDDIIQNPSLTHTCAQYKNGWSRYFEGGIVDVPCEAEGGLPRMQVIDRAVKEFFPNPPNVYVDVYERLLFTLKTLQNYTPQPDKPLTFPFKGKNYEVNVWILPFLLRPYYAGGLFEKAVKEYDPQLEEYRGARLEFLLGNFDEALKQFDTLLKNCKGKDCRDDVEYFKCLCYFEARDYQSCVSQLHSYLNNYPNGVWIAGAIYHLARSYEAMGLNQKALEEYKKIEVSANVQQRIKDLK